MSAGCSPTSPACWPTAGINIANANLHRTAKRGDAYTVLETDSAVDASVREL